MHYVYIFRANVKLSPREMLITMKYLYQNHLIVKFSLIFLPKAMRITVKYSQAQRHLHNGIMIKS